MPRPTRNFVYCVNCQGCGLLADDLVHPWLRKARLVGLVVPVAPIADDIYDDIYLSCTWRGNWLQADKQM